MATYSKSSGVGGEWVDKAKLTNGQRAKIITESVPTEETYEGKPKTRNIVKVVFEGDKEPKNVDLNRATVNGLIDAFGPDSKEWMNKVLTVHAEKAVIGGSRKILLYLLPPGFEVAEDSGGYLIVQPVGMDKPEPPVPGDIGYVQPEGEGDINPEDIPF